MSNIIPDPDTDDPIIASYDIFITDALIRRLLLQYPDRQPKDPYDGTYRVPTELRLKPKTGLVEVDIPITTQANYNDTKGLRFGNALRKSRITSEGGSHGVAGGFNATSSSGAAGAAGGGGGGAGKGRFEPIDVEEDERFAGFVRDADEEDRKAGVLMMTQTLGGRIKAAVEGDPVYMLGAFRD
ncbi:hypothetical protein AJ80_07019, partial [Polytolypa hystricis UAMH7299]